MHFSIIIPTYKRNDLLALCLQRLQPGAQSLEANLYEVIVTDDAADAETEQLLLTQFPWATYTAGPQKGPAANRNRGAALATGQWLVFTDDDCLPDAHWLQAYNEAITAHPQCQAFEGAILPDDWALLKKDMAECPVNTVGGCFWSANIMLAKSLFQELGGFDEQFTIAAQEDQDLQWRIQQQHAIVFVQQAKVVHPVRKPAFFFWEKNKCKRLSSVILKNKKQGKSNVAILFVSLWGLMNAIWQTVKKKQPLYMCHLILHCWYQCIMFPILFFQFSNNRQRITNTNKANVKLRN
ncbi:glycosyltransferase family 2 protein [Phnomibacter sp. MR]|uniref:glycosyltransferase family 2 protein n=1 Tax=Phnomibacter sp. MR TaxID=3042318 RepID=UPI003A807F5B